MKTTLRWAALLCLALSTPAWAASPCERLQRQAQAGETHMFPRANYRVAGKGRLYFHSAPGARCRAGDVYVVPGDELVAYSAYRGWVSVMYVNPETGEDFQGWVRPERLKFAGTLGPK